MLEISYDGEVGYTVPDEMAISYMMNIYKTGYSKVTVGTICMLDAARVLIRRGFIAPGAVQFRFNGEIIKHDKDANLEKWPRGFGDTLDRFMIELYGPKSEEVKLDDVPFPET